MNDETNQMQEPLVLVNPFNHRTGVAQRAACHQGAGIRHRAFVVFLFAGDGKMLIQKRAGSKLGGDCWDVSATSHVWADESYGAAINRCLVHELGITTQVRPRYKLAFAYQQQLGESAENEHCSLFLLDHDGNVSANTREIDEIRWVAVADLKAWFEKSANQFTPWFAEAFGRMLTTRTVVIS